MSRPAKKTGWKGVSYVYLLFCEEVAGLIHVKIGKSNHPEKRITAYKTHCPLALQSFYTCELKSEVVAFEKEREMQRRLSYLVGRGEWRVLNCGRQVEEVFAAATEVLVEPLVRAKI